MIDLSQFPSPDNAPAPGECIRVERPEEGLVVVTFVSPHRSFPVLDAPLLRDLDQVLTDIENEPDDAQSMVRLLVYANQFEIEGIVDEGQGIDPGDASVEEEKGEIVHTRTVLRREIGMEIDSKHAEAPPRGGVVEIGEV